MQQRIGPRQSRTVCCTFRSAVYGQRQLEVRTWYRLRVDSSNPGNSPLLQRYIQQSLEMKAFRCRFCLTFQLCFAPSWLRSTHLPWICHLAALLPCKASRALMCQSHKREHKTTARLLDFSSTTTANSRNSKSHCKSPACVVKGRKN